MAKRVQDWFSRIWPWRKRNVATAARITEEDTLTRTLGRFEHYVVEVQKLLIWENPSPTVAVTQDWTPVHPRILTVPEISHYLSMAHCLAEDYYKWLCAMRSEQPQVFCVGMCSFCLGLTLIGRAVPGFLILYVAVMAVMIIPGACMYLLPESTSDRLRALPAIFKSGNDSEEEYLPDQTGENLAFLQHAGESDSDHENDFEETNHFAESLTLDSEPGDSSGTGTQASFTTGVNVMPSHDDGSVDGLDVSEFDLPAPVPTKTENGRAERQLDPEASDSDEDDLAGIQFQSSHFNGDTSEEEEEKMAQGLLFPDNGNGKQREEAVRGQSLGEMLTSTVVGAVAKNITNLGAMGQSLLSTVISSPSVVQTQTPRRDEEVSLSDSDDFEMISEEDFS